MILVVCREMLYFQSTLVRPQEIRTPGLFDERRTGKGSKLIKVRIIPGPHINFPDLYPNLPNNHQIFH